MGIRRFAFSVFSLLTVLLFMTGIVQAQTHIEIKTPMIPPNWAFLERELLRASAEGCNEFAERYLDDRGFLKCREHWGGNDGPDDAMENFYNWTLLYTLGASESVLALYKKAWEGHLLQYTEATADSAPITKNGMYYKEFVVSFDWEHNGEGLAAFLLYGLSKPTDIFCQKRIRRYAGFYMNEDPDAPNYDPVHKIIRSLHNGSRGPKLTPATVYDWGGDPVQGESRHEHYTTAANIKGDHPLNLCATALAINAYMIAHEPKYKGWLLEYADAWRERIVANGGNTPTNIGLDGAIGGEWDGKWYGGVFGWNFWPQSTGRNYFRRGLQIAFGSALILTGGDQRFVDVMRMQMDNIYSAKRIVDGKLMVPHKYGDDGWYGYTTDLYTHFLRDIYCFSMNPSDLERLSDDGWIQFLEGKNPDYPEEALRMEFSRLRQKIQGIHEDYSTPDSRNSDDTQRFNPAMTSTLVNLMLGGNEPRQIGNILHCRVRYFDPDKRRAGIPEDVGSLVTEMNKDMTKITLVNINQVEPRDVIVQTGAFGEHQCMRVETGDKVFPVNNRFFHVHLAPGAGAELVIYTQRYANPPTLAFPWHGDMVPLP